MRLLNLFILFGFMVLVPSAWANANKESTKVGAFIPQNLELKDSKGDVRNFANLTGKKGMVLVFIRSAGWCPYCQTQLLELDKNYKKFTDYGYEVVSISYDNVDVLKKFTTKHNPKITLLSDPASESIRAFGLLNENIAKGTNAYGIANPAIYIVSKDKKVQKYIAEEGYKKRPSAEAILAALKKLNPPPALKIDRYFTMEHMGSDPIEEGLDVIDIPDKILDPAMPVLEDEPLIPDNLE